MIRTFEDFFFGDLVDLLSETEKDKQRETPRYKELKSCWINAEETAVERYRRKYEQGGMGL